MGRLYKFDSQRNKIDYIFSDTIPEEWYPATFLDFDLLERQNLQEWIARDPNCLCFKQNSHLLIIGKEVPVGIQRLDLLAIDETGNLVIIENKLGASGKDIVGQALNYAAFCSSLSVQEIFDIYDDYLGQKGAAEPNILNFFKSFGRKVSTLDECSINSTQRVILVAENFHEEIAKTVLWLRNKSLLIECFCFNPYFTNENVFIEIKSLIPLSNDENIDSITSSKLCLESLQNSGSLISTTQEHKNKIIAGKNITLSEKEQQKKYWVKLLEKYNEIDGFFSHIKPKKDSYIYHWLGGGYPKAYFCFRFGAKLIQKKRFPPYVSVEFGVYDIKAYDKLVANRVSIEKEFGHELEWYSNYGGNEFHVIQFVKYDANVNDETKWDELFDFHCNHMPKFKSVISKYLK